MENCKPPLSHQLAFQVQIFSKGKGIHITVINEGASTYIMSASCWLALGSSTLSLLLNSLKAFGGHTFIPKGCLDSYPINLYGKMVTMDIEVVNKKLEYNLLLGRIWMYAMMAIVSTIICLILFPLDGKVVTVDQLSFCTPNYSPLPSGFVPLVGGVPNSYVSLGTGLLKASSLMGCFPIEPPKVSHMVNMISSIPHEQIDPWILPAPSNIDTYREQMPMSPVELAYQAIQFSYASLVTLVTPTVPLPLP